MKLEAIEELRLGRKEMSFYLHDGYSGWSYGSPQNPLLINDKDGILILNSIESNIDGSIMDLVTKVFPSLQYATEGSVEWQATMKNRFHTTRQKISGQ